MIDVNAVKKWHWHKPCCLKRHWHKPCCPKRIIGINPAVSAISLSLIISCLRTPLPDLPKLSNLVQYLHFLYVCDTWEASCCVGNISNVTLITANASHDDISKAEKVLTPLRRRKSLQRCCLVAVPKPWALYHHPTWMCMLPEPSVTISVNSISGVWLF